MEKETCSTSEDMKIIEASTNPFVRLIARLFGSNLDEEEILALEEITETTQFYNVTAPDDREMDAVMNEIHRRSTIAYQTLVSKYKCGFLPSGKKQ